MASLANGGLRRHLGFHVLSTEERGSRTDTRRGGLVGMGQPAWALLCPVSANLVPRFVFCILGHLLLQLLWTLDVVIPATKLRGLYA
jgi:hypothetical protein